MDDRLTPEELQMVLEARERKEKEVQAKGAAELFKILDQEPQQANAGMSRKFTFDMFGGEPQAGEDDEPPAA